ncbi:MAG: hypothetical protein E2600_01340 [Chryseobacterium sp.]|nr:hypothetical protein [Chryseobacterium sp.]
MKNIHNYIFSVKNKSRIDSTEIIHNKHSRKNRLKLSKNDYEETIIKWSFFKYIKEIDYDLSNFEFVSQSSSQQLNNGLSATSILEIINSDLIFDYTPLRNDMLQIYMEYIHQTINNKPRPYIGNYISFIYKNEWIINEGFEHIDNVYEIIQEGFLKLV